MKKTQMIEIVLVTKKIFKVEPRILRAQNDFDKMQYWQNCSLLSKY